MNGSKQGKLFKVVVSVGGISRGVNAGDTFTAAKRDERAGNCDNWASKWRRVGTPTEVTLYEITKIAPNKSVYLQGRENARNNKAFARVFVQARCSGASANKRRVCMCARGERGAGYYSCIVDAPVSPVKQCKMVDSEKQREQVRLRESQRNEYRKGERGRAICKRPDMARAACVALHRWISIDARIRQHHWLSFFKWKFAGRSELILWDTPEKPKRFALSARYTTVPSRIWSSRLNRLTVFLNSSRWRFHIGCSVNVFNSVFNTLGRFFSSHRYTECTFTLSPHSTRSFGKS